MKYYYAVRNRLEYEREITEISFEVFEELLSEARSGYCRRKWGHGFVPCEFVVHYWSPQELNEEVFEESKVIVLTLKS